MASISSSSVSVTKKYDVFISFRGEDTRRDFTSHLHAALCRNSIDAYIDYRIQKGDEVWVELVKAIKESNLFLVIFSENYASSSWCLNELVELMECRKQGEDVDVIPVFYRTEPSQVRKQSGSYETAFAKHKKDGKVSRENMQNWKNALFHAANLSGFDSHAYRIEADLIEDIVKAVLQKLNHKYTNDFRGLFIYDENYSNIVSLLKNDSKEVRVIGIWGMGGIGKTTLAAAIFHKVSSQYEATCFLENVAEESKRHGLNYVCNKLLSKLLREDLHIDTAKVIPSIVTGRLRRKKVLIVLDDVNTSQLLENLVGVGRDWLGAGSRVIVTTRDKQVLISGDVDKIHQVKEMNLQNSLKLFGLNAFGKTYPKMEYVELSKRVMVYAKGIPLALKVLGSFLRSKSEHEWDSALSKLKKIPNGEIQAVLRLSYDGLDDDEKNIFLDIACLFKGQKRDHITKLLNACDFSADIGISRLLDKALLTITYNNCIDMHDLIQEMGRAIVREESIQNPGQRSRLWDPEEVYDVLKNERGTGAVEGIWLDMSQIKNINLSSKAFRNMPNMRLLAFLSFNEDCQRTNSVYLPKGLEFLPKQLRYFGWNGYPLESLPSTFCPERLVKLSMRYSNVKKLWHGVQNLPNLESINLRGSKHLMECPNLSHAPKLKQVIMRECDSLPYVDPSILSLPKLEILDVCGCTSLKCLNGNTWSSQSLRGLFFRGSGLNELPPSILLIRNLKTFSFSIHFALLDLPENFVSQIVLTESKKHERDTFFTLQKVLPSSGFRSLTGLTFDKCESLCEIPNNISLLSSLQYLTLYYCSIIGFPESIKYLSRLKVLEVYECKMLQSIPELPQSIQRLHVWKCQSLQTVSCSTIEPSKTPERIFLLPNCITLDEHSYDAILRDAIVRIELGAKPPAATVLENKEDATTDNYLHESSKIGYSLPARSGKVRDWFHCHFTQALVTIELPPNLLGFIFYLVVSQVQSCHIGCCGSIGCECYLETGRDERINITSFFLKKTVMLWHPPPFQFITDHVFLWYDAQCCKQIMEVIKERKAINDKSTTNDPKLTFKFFAQTKYNDQEVIVKECGFRWMYSLEKGGSMSKRKREVDESNEQEEAFPPTKKLKQRVFGTSNLEAEGIEELRCRLEERLHIGFGGDFM